MKGINKVTSKLKELKNYPGYKLAIYANAYAIKGVVVDTNAKENEVVRYLGVLRFIGFFSQYYGCSRRAVYYFLSQNGVTYIE